MGSTRLSPCHNGRRHSSGNACRCEITNHRIHSLDSHEPSSSDSEVEASPFVGRYSKPTGCFMTESVRQVDTICGQHTYTLVGYTLSRAMGPGTRLCSDLFEVGGQLFRLEVYPAGLDRDSRNYVSLFLTTPGTTRPGHLLYELSILDKSGSKPQHITEARTAFLPSSSPEPAAVLAPFAGVVAGFPRFIKANFLHRHLRRFLPDDTLSVRATVKVLTGRSSFPMPQCATTQAQVFSLQPNYAAAAAAALPPGPSLQLQPLAGTPGLSLQPGGVVGAAGFMPQPWLPSQNSPYSYPWTGGAYPGAAALGGAFQPTGLSLSPALVAQQTVAPGAGLYGNFGVSGLASMGAAAASSMPMLNSLPSQLQTLQLQQHLVAGAPAAWAGNGGSSIVWR